MATSRDVGALEAVRVVQAEAQEQLFRLPNVVAVGIGSKVVKNQDTDELALSVFVEQKLPEDALPKEHVVPKQLRSYKTDVVESGPIFAGESLRGALGEATEEVGVEVLRGRIRPAMGGYSVGHYQITAGTIATMVYDAGAFTGIPQHYYVLSNNHVLANTNRARVGDPILQPGPYDGGTQPADVIARLSRYVPINFAAGAINYVDCALAEGEFAALDREIYWIGYSRGATAPVLRMVVQKTGRTTNYTTGVIAAVNASVTVNYGGGQQARFAGQIITTAMSAPRDSGSLVLDLENHAVGLLFAGSSRVTILNDIRIVQQLLGIRIP